MRTFFRFLGFAAVSFAAAAAGARVTRRNKLWYRALRKAPQTPPDGTFGVVWPILYTLGALSAARVLGRPPSPERSRSLRWWATALAANAAWSPVFFGAHRPRLALGVLAANAVVQTAFAGSAWNVDRPAALMALPTLAWLGFASTLNAGVIDRNRWLVRG